MPDQEARQARGGGLGTGLRLQGLGKFRHRDVRLLFDPAQEKVFVWRQLAYAAAPLTGYDRTGTLPAIHQLDRAACAYPETVGSFSP